MEAGLLAINDEDKANLMRMAMYRQNMVLSGLPKAMGVLDDDAKVMKTGRSRGSMPRSVASRGRSPPPQGGGMFASSVMSGTLDASMVSDDSGGEMESKHQEPSLTLSDSVSDMPSDILEQIFDEVRPMMREIHLALAGPSCCC